MSAHYLGTWLSSGSAVVAELAGECGFDWVLIDLEHGCGSEGDVPDQLRALRGSRTRAIVRVGAPSPDVIARVLDWGAHGIMVPHVNSAEDALACVRGMTYPPVGERGVSRSVRAYRYGMDSFPGNDPERRPVFLPQIETIKGVAQAEAIARVDGVTALFVGPADLQFDLQARPDEALWSFEECLQRVSSAARAAGKDCGLLIRDQSQLERFLQDGWSWLAVESDLGLLRAGYQQLCQSWGNSQKS